MYSTFYVGAIAFDSNESPAFSVNLCDDEEKYDCVAYLREQIATRANAYFA